MITLRQANNPQQAKIFERKNNIRLHLNLKDIETLNSIYKTLIQMEGVSLEFEPKLFRDGSAKHIMFSIPSGIRIKILAPGS